VTLFQPAARSRRFERKTHLDIGRGERIAGEPLTFSQFALPEGHVLLELRIDQRGQRLIGYLAHQRAQQCRRELWHQREQQLQEQRRHRRAFGVMQPIGIAQPLRRPGRRDQAALAVGIDDVFGDRAGLRDGVAVIGDNWRFSERMDRAQLCRRVHIWLTLIADDRVGQVQLFQQPQHALRARVIEMMDGEHNDSPGDTSLLFGARWCQQGLRKSRWHTGFRYYPDIIDNFNLPG